MDKNTTYKKNDSQVEPTLVTSRKSITEYIVVVKHKKEVEKNTDST